VELNTKGRYAVMAMVDIAKHAACDETMPLSVIAERQNISLAYLEQLFVKLRRVGLVESARGRSGGYRLGRAASMITIADVLRAVEEDVQMTRCGIDGGAPCVGGHRCLTHDLWDALGDHIEQFLVRTTLQQVVDGVVQRSSVPPAVFSAGLPFGAVKL
jgi:Rrf2 family transcriptional regulator, iron-sulfur cluster assembly transcription factor